MVVEDEFPCDLLLAYTKSENGTCFIKTSNLDGETNLKMRSVPAKFPTFACPEDLASLTGTIVCEKPNTRLYDFKGKLILQNQEMYLKLYFPRISLIKKNHLKYINLIKSNYK